MKNQSPAKGEKSDDFIVAAERPFARVARKLRAEDRALSGKIRSPLKVPFGTAKFCRLRNARYLTWRDAFDVEFDDGLCILEPHRTIRKANEIAAKATPTSVELEPETRSGFFVHYDNGQTAEVSWSFIRELPPAKSMRITEDVRRYAADQGISDEAAIEKGMQEKVNEFVTAGDIYQKA